MKRMVRPVFWSVAVGAMLGCAATPPPARVENLGAIATTEPGESADQVALGRLLFHDKRLSKKREIACNGCHTLTKFGVDGKPSGIAVGGLGGALNVPSVFNTQAHIAQVWDARSPSGLVLAAEAIMKPVDLALSDALGRIPRYVELFRKAFPNDARPISLQNAGDAIEAFERRLVSSSRWDRFVAGDVTALTMEEKQGLRVFLRSGCAACHSGQYVGGAMFQRLGLAYPWPNPKGDKRSVGANSIADRMIFQVPSLKNIAETSPYFHDASTSNLQAAIRLMGHHQLGVELSNEDVDAIAAWMRSLTGDVDQSYIVVPELPPES